MSTRAYGFSVLASLVLIAASAAPAAHKFFTGAPAGEGGHPLPQGLLVGDLSVATDHATGQSRGFGFVDKASVEGANSVIRERNGQELDGRQLRIELANPAAESRGDFRGRAAGKDR